MKIFVYVYNFVVKLNKINDGLNIVGSIKYILYGWRVGIDFYG